MIQRMCSTKWDMHHKLCVNSRIFHGQSFINIFSKSILWYNVVIVTIVSRNLAIILEILELYTHLSTNLSNCPYCVTFINHKQKIRYFGIIWQSGRPEFVLHPILFTKCMKLLGSIYRNKSKDHKKYFDTCLVMSYTGGRRKHGRKSCWVRT